MAKTVNLVNSETGSIVAGTITEEEYNLYISEGYADETPASTDPA